MTYLFIVIALGLIMAVSQGNILTLLLIAGIVVFFTVLLESNWLVKREYAQQVYYEKIELIHKERQLELIADLKKVTGLDIHRIEIQEIDLLKDAAKIIVYYH
jgi:sensor domain CHASE-containing protein